MKKRADDCKIDWTPMIDCVFQLIIFFVVTLNMDKETNKEIEMQLAPHAPVVKNEGRDPRTLEIEVDRRGKISMNGIYVPKDMIRTLVHNRYNKFGRYPVVIRGDRRTSHSDIKTVMDICSGAGLYQINFAALKEEKQKK